MSLVTRFTPLANNSGLLVLRTVFLVHSDKDCSPIESPPPSPHLRHVPPETKGWGARSVSAIGIGPPGYPSLLVPLTIPPARPVSISRAFRYSLARANTACGDTPFHRKRSRRPFSRGVSPFPRLSPFSRVLSGLPPVPLLSSPFAPLLSIIDPVSIPSPVVCHP